MILGTEVLEDFEPQGVFDAQRIGLVVSEETIESSEKLEGLQDSNKRTRTLFIENVAVAIVKKEKDDEYSGRSKCK